MESRSHAIVAGLFAIFLSVGLVLTLWWFSDKREQTRDVLLVSSGSVNGLNLQAAVRYRGTIGGSIANNDPAADFPAALVALDATVKTSKLATVLPRLSLGLAGHDGLRGIPLKHPTPRRGLGLLWKKGGYRSGAAQALADQVHIVVNRRWRRKPGR